MSKKYKRFGNNDLWQVHLMEMISYTSITNGYKYSMTCNDVFSRFARLMPLKTKSAVDVYKTLETMLETKLKHSN